MYIISNCLLGENCKYNGENNFEEWVSDFAKHYSCLGICPEEEGGFPTPRPPAEIKEGRVINNQGLDVTTQFSEGAKAALKRARLAAGGRGEIIEGAILKARSPSCGKNQIYDGSFSSKMTAGDGIFVKLLLGEGIKVINEIEGSWPIK